MKRALFISLLFFLIAEKLMEAAPIKISFLDNEDAIQQTTEFLLAKGCDQESVLSFRRVLDSFYYLPRSTTKENLRNELLQTLRFNWEREGIKFPKEMEMSFAMTWHLLTIKGLARSVHTLDYYSETKTDMFLLRS